MAAELIRNEADGTLSFGDYTLSEKKKQEDFKAGGVSYKVKTFKEITRLEGDGDLVYESVPGTNVSGLKRTASGLVFEAEGGDDAQITVGVFLSAVSVGRTKHKKSFTRRERKTVILARSLPGNMPSAPSACGIAHDRSVFCMLFFHRCFS